MIANFNSVGIRGMYVTIRKATYDKATANIIINYISIKKPCFWVVVL